MAEFERQVGAVEWRNREQRLKLIGVVCDCCNLKIFPPTIVCPDCSSEVTTKFAFSGRGEIYTYTTQLPPPGKEEDGPKTIAIIKLVEGPFLAAQITDLANPFDPQDRLNSSKPLEIGTQVEMVTRIVNKNGDRGIINYSYKFRPVELKSL